MHTRQNGWRCLFFTVLRLTVYAACKPENGSCFKHTITEGENSSDTSCYTRRGLRLTLQQNRLQRVEYEYTPIFQILREKETDYRQLKVSMITNSLKQKQHELIRGKEKQKLCSKVEA